MYNLSVKALQQTEVLVVNVKVVSKDKKVNLITEMLMDKDQQEMVIKVKDQQVQNLIQQVNADLIMAETILADKMQTVRKVDITEVLRVKMEMVLLKSHLVLKIQGN